jgi:hypothetical protein
MCLLKKNFSQLIISHEINLVELGESLRST